MRAALGALFVVTGAACLLVEQALEKMLTTIVGASTTAGSLVLSLYFVGLALGGFAYGRLRDAVPRMGPIRLYGTLEGAVGAYALVLALALAPLQAASARLIHLAGDAAGAVFLLRLLVAALWVLPPTICMGASFPAVVAALRREAARDAAATQGRGTASIVRFYTLNLLGALLGSIAGPYVLFAHLGLARSMIALACAQLAVFALATLLDRRAAPPAPVDARAAREGDDAASLVGSVRAMLAREGGALLLATAFASGLIVFSAEVLWLHLMGVTLGMSVYTFANLLAIVLASLFVGGTLSSSLFPRRASVPDLAMPFALAAAAAILGATARRWDDVPVAILSWSGWAQDFYRGEVVRILLALPVVALPCIALGVVYPMLFRLAAFPTALADRAAGVLGAVNALGSMIGALAVAFVLLPGLGSEGTSLVLACAPLALAIAWVVVIVRRARATATLSLQHGALAVAVVAASAVATQPASWHPLQLTSGINVYFHPGFTLPTSKLVYWHEDAEGGITTVVADPETTELTLLTNGKFQGNDTGEVADQTAIALFPCATTRGRDSALVIGLGTGQSGAVVEAAGFRALEVVDISRGIEGAARGVFAPLNGALLERPHVRFVHEDGRNHLLRSTQRYDLIGMELSSVWFAGVGNLYSREFYELARDRLAPGGVLQQWVQLHHIAPDELFSAIATVREVFPYVTLWSLHAQGVIVASMTPIAPLPDVVAELQKSPRLAPHLARILPPEQLARDGALFELLRAHQLLDADGASRLAERARARGVPLNTDANRFLEYWTPRHNLERVDTVPLNIAALREAARP